MDKIKNQNGKLDVAWLDFKAAYDMIDRDLLLEKAGKVGIKGKMLKMIKGIYTKKPEMKL